MIIEWAAIGRPESTSMSTHGIKQYSSYWTDEGHQSFTMDGPEHAFPLWEQHTAEPGLNVIAVRKRCRSVPSP